MQIQAITPNTPTLCSEAVKTPLLNALKKIYSLTVSFFYYTTFTWVLFAVLYRSHRLYANAKISGIKAIFEKAQECTKKESVLSYLLQIKNGSKEFRITVAKDGVESGLEQAALWIDRLTKRQKCDLKGFSTTIYSIAADRRWTRLTTDRRNLSVIDLAKITRGADFVAKIKWGDFVHYVAQKRLEPKEREAIEYVNLSGNP